MPQRLLALMMFILPAMAVGQSPKYDYRLLASNKTSTMEKEMNEAADAGFHFGGVMGGETSFGGKEVVVAMIRDDAETSGTIRKYKLLATTKTSTLQKEMAALGEDGYEYKGQTIFESTFGGKEVSAIMERGSAATPRRYVYRVLATNRTSTMQKELREAGESGFRLLGISVGKSAMGGAEILSIVVKEEK